MMRNIGSIARILEAEVADSSQALEGLEALETLAVVVVASMVGDTGMEAGYQDIYLCVYSVDRYLHNQVPATLATTSCRRPNLTV